MKLKEATKTSLRWCPCRTSPARLDPPPSHHSQAPSRTLVCMLSIDLASPLSKSNAQQSKLLGGGAIAAQCKLVRLSESIMLG